MNPCEELLLILNEMMLSKGTFMIPEIPGRGLGPAKLTVQGSVDGTNQ